MDKKRGFLFLALLQAVLLYADDYKWNFVNALVQADMQAIERILDDNGASMSVNEKRLIYGFALTYTRSQDTVLVLGMLLNHNIHPVQYDLFNAINKGHDDEVVGFILNQGIRPNGEILLTAAERKRWNLVAEFTAMGADVNYRYPQGKSYADGMTALMYAAAEGSLETVRTLVEHGADINLRANNGHTAVSLALENGRGGVHSYLMEHGGVDYYLPGAREVQGRGITSLVNPAAAFTAGTYRLSGGTGENAGAELRFRNGGNLTYRNSGGQNDGTYQLSGNILTINMSGLVFTYTINPDRSLTGGGETWIRTGD